MAEKQVETKFNIDNEGHQILLATMAMLVEEYGYKPRELQQLMEHTYNRSFFALGELHKEKYLKH